MQKGNDLKRIQKKIYMAYFEDGLWDMLLGFYLVAWGFTMTFDVVAVLGGVWVAAYAMVIGLKRILVYPRSGYIKLPETRKRYMKVLLLGIVLLIAGLVGYGLIVLGDRPDWVGDFLILILGGMMALVVLLMGYWFQVTRWYLYGILLVLTSVAQQWFDLPLNLTFFIPGGVAVVWGLYCLIRFLRKYPKSTGEEMNVLS